jgi:LysM repeat protein
MATTRTTEDQTTTDVPPPQIDSDTLHFVGTQDSLQSLSLAYNVPPAVLRRRNNLFSDQLLAARKWIAIPRSHYTGPALSTPPDQETEERKTKLRRWMVATKCADYGVATLYLKGSDYNLAVAVEAFQADEEWERNHPIIKGKERETDGPGRATRSRFRGGGSLSGQLS